MNLWFRLLYLAFKNLLSRRRVTLGEETELVFYVMPSDIDFNRHVTNSRYLALMDLGRIDHMDRIGALRPMLRRKIAPILAELDVQFLRPLKLFERFTVRSHISHWDEKWVYWDQTFYNSMRKPVATCKARGVLKVGRKAVVPGEFFSQLEPLRR